MTKVEQSNAELKKSNDALQRQVELGYDKRLSYFKSGMSASSGRHTEANNYMNSEYQMTCLFCEEPEDVHSAHIVAATKDCDYKEFGKSHGYKDDLNLKSPRNFIPLCGTKGQVGTCHNEFDNYAITLIYNPLSKKYVVYCLNRNFKEGVLHNKEIEISGEFPPYRRLLAWRSRHCAQVNQFLFADNNSSHVDFLTACKFSEDSRSISKSHDGV